MLSLLVSGPHGQERSGLWYHKVLVVSLRQFHISAGEGDVFARSLPKLDCFLKGAKRLHGVQFSCPRLPITID